MAELKLNNGRLVSYKQTTHVAEVTEIDESARIVNRFREVVGKALPHIDFIQSGEGMSYHLTKEGKIDAVYKGFTKDFNTEKLPAPAKPASAPEAPQGPPKAPTGQPAGGPATPLSPPAESPKTAPVAHTAAAAGRPVEPPSTDHRIGRQACLNTAMNTFIGDPKFQALSFKEKLACIKGAAAELEAWVWRPIEGPEE